VLRSDLTSEQYKAATDPARDILGLACAGSGKSRTLGFRIARLVAESANPAEVADGIVAFTFTEKAADSMKLRVGWALERAGLPAMLLGRMFIGTIHSYCQNMLTQVDARYRQFDVLDENRLRLYLISRWGALGLKRLRKVWSAGYFQTIDQVADAWTTMNDEMITIGDVAAAANGPAERELAKVLEQLSARLAAHEFIDFSLMIRLVVEALESEDPTADRITQPLRHLMVDEYQDINQAQERLIQRLRKRAEILFVVGDDDQAIFAWRGADVDYILSFLNRFRKSARRTLSENFRSTGAIVEAADGFASAELGAKRIAKQPRAAENRSPRDFRVLWFPKRLDEAAWVAERIDALLGTAYEEGKGAESRTRGLTPGDFAILMRSTRMEEGNGEPRHMAFTRALARRNIPYTLEAGGSVFDRPHVAVMRAAFELLRDGPPNPRQIQQFFQTQVLPVFPHGDIKEFRAVFSNWGRLIHEPITGARRRVYPQSLVHELLGAFGLAKSNFDDGIMHDLGVFSVMIQDVETVYLSVDSPWRFREVLNFLSNTAERGYDSSTLDVLRRPDAVSIMTVHKAKGLEFPAVFVVDVEDGRFPGTPRGYNGWLPQKAIRKALARGAYQKTRQEETRLFYTAITRAERYLYVSGAESLPGGKRKRSPSPFALGLVHSEIKTDSTALPRGLKPHPQQRRIDETVMPTSYSELRYYLRCPRDYKFRKTFGFSPPIPDMFGFGMTVHAAVGKLHELYRNKAPSGKRAEAVAREIFHLKHVPPSRDPENKPGPYERAQDSAAGIVRKYAEHYSQDFTKARQVEQSFEIPIKQGVVSGSIDLLLKVDPQGNVVEADVVDFKSMTGGPEPKDNPDLHWTELAIQVQLYAKAARDVLGENARTGHVHLLKDGKRVEVPVDDEAVAAAIANIEWAVDRIIHEDFPMRPHDNKCENCDFGMLCAKRPESFANGQAPPKIHIPNGQQLARAFSEFGTKPDQKAKRAAEQPRRKKSTG
jgi:DNA helicase-2/ATP-dependent DNA helicase PcrA